MNQLFEADVLIRDGDRIEFGNIQIDFRLVPGHTAGCVACLFDVIDGNEKKRVGYYGGFGFNTLQKEYLEEIGDHSFSMRKTYLESLKKVREEKVELFIGNHTSDVDLLDKRNYMLENQKAENPFLNDHAWKEYLDKKYKMLIQEYFITMQ